MNILKKIRILLACLTLFSVKIKAQDVSINIINQPATLTQGSALGRVMVDICNNDGGSRNAAVGKLRPLISFPSSLVGNTVVPITFVGWTVLANDGQYLGKLTFSRYDSDSILNKYGSYGSQYSSTSIFNKYSNYGSQYSSLSPFNKYTSTPPTVYYKGEKVGYLTKNRYVGYGSSNIDPDQLFEWMKSKGITQYG